jgi:NADP-dependent 3-hydroxy acid dehydrogenase YdfG
VAHAVSLISCLRCVDAARWLPRSVNVNRRRAAVVDGERPVVVVTGGTAGVGRAAVREFAARGYDVAVLARGEDGARGSRRRG